MKEKSNIIQGGQFEDERGKLIFFNDFDMKPVKRFYIIEHLDTSVVRAWQGHQKEQKWFYVTKGCFRIILLQPDNWENPSEKLPFQEVVLKASAPEVLAVPAGFVNGFKALESESGIMVFSSFTVEESACDNFRFDKDKWYNWNKE
jgi:dTDP-4-dehydrorhamnose 3,5-epimerase-like enzyme